MKIVDLGENAPVFLGVSDDILSLTSSLPGTCDIFRSRLEGKLAKLNPLLGVGVDCFSTLLLVIVEELC